MSKLSGRLAALAVVVCCGCGGTGHVGVGPADMPGDAADEDGSPIEKDAGLDLDEGGDAGPETDADGLDGSTPPPSVTYQQLGASAWTTVNAFFHAGPSRWYLCLPTSSCTSDTNQDWGADTLTGLVWLHWKLTQDAKAVTLLTSLIGSSPDYVAGTSNWSDIPMWDSIAASHEWEATAGNATALKKATDAFVFVDGSKLFAQGACSTIDYQQPNGNTKLKTLETDANYIKAALLLYQETKDSSYLTKAETKYANVRKYFLDPHVALYTVYVVDDGKTCTQIPQRFFGSVNGAMIDNGRSLYAATKTQSYEDDALATAKAVGALLSDANGVYADLQAANDTSEPLIEAMYHLSLDGQAFATTWLMQSASAAGAASAKQGTYSRFFDGPAPDGFSDAWQTSGGLAVEMVAGKLEPTKGPADPSYWASATYEAHDLMVTTTAGTLTFTGEAIALIGEVGETTSESGHASVLIDGVETEDQTGIWQNKLSASTKEPNQVLFAWRWPTSGTHTLTIDPGTQDVKEGASFFHMTGYKLK